MDENRPSPRTPAQRAGDAAEDLVALRLEAAGWRIVGRRVRLGRGEIDLIALDPTAPEWLVVLEVRWRSSRSHGLPEETFDRRKRIHLRAAIGRLLDLRRLPDGRPLPAGLIRVDLVVVEPPRRPGDPVRIRHHRDVLEA